MLMLCGSLSAQFAPPSGGCPPGMHLEGFACVYDAPAQPSAPRPQEWVNVYVAVAWHHNASDVWAIWNVRDLQGGLEAAKEAVLSDCRKVMGEGCTIAQSSTNSSISIARRPNGFLVTGWGETPGAAKSNVLAYCTSKVMCTITHVFTAKPWVEYTDVPGFDEMKRYRPSGRNIKARFGAAVLSESDNPLWTNKVWTSAGHTTEAEAYQAARNKCIADSAGQCEAWTANMDGVIAIYRDENLKIDLINERNTKAASQAVRKKCEQNKVKCTLVDLIDVKRAGFKIVDPAATK